MAIGARNQANQYRMGNTYPPYQLGALTAGGFSTAPNWTRTFYKGEMPPATTYDTAPPANPILDTGSAQYTNLVHAWPVLPVDSTAEDEVNSQDAGLTNGALTTSSTEFGDTPNMTTGRPAATDADYYALQGSYTPSWNQDGPVTFSLWWRPERYVQYGQHMFYPGEDATAANRIWIGCQPHSGATDAAPTGVGGKNKGRKDWYNNRNVYWYMRSGGTGADTANVLYSIEHPQFKADPDTWYLMVAAYDRNAGTYKLWMNGVEVPQIGPRWFDNTATCTDWSAAFDSIGIGGTFRTGASAGASVQGSAIDFRIYNVVLSQEKVDAMFAISTRWELWGGTASTFPYSSSIRAKSRRRGIGHRMRGLWLK